MNEQLDNQQDQEEIMAKQTEQEQDIAQIKLQKIEDVETEYSKLSKSPKQLYTSMPLFLPPVVNPIEDNEPFSYAPSVLSSMEQQCIIKQTRNDRDQALMEAKQ